MTEIKIATRQSPLALWQANFVRDRLLSVYPEITVTLVTFVTQGDKILDTPLAKIGGKGLFVKELEQALYQGEADIAVHSLKDVPMVMPEGLTLSTYCQREAATDAFVSNAYKALDELPIGAHVGTSSMRRQAQLLSYRPDFKVTSLRGNVGTRLGKLDSGQYDAIILATSGLQRLALDNRIAHELPVDISLPAVGQGALAIECRSEDAAVQQYLSVLDHLPTRHCVSAERAMNRALQGGCQVPIAGYAIIENGEIWLRGRVGRVDGTTLLKVSARDKPENAERLGQHVAEQLSQQGADEILAEIYDG